jgi:chromate transporter
VRPREAAIKAPGRPSTADLLRYFLYLGSLGFGGPVALVGYMQRGLVERRGWWALRFGDAFLVR